MKILIRLPNWLGDAVMAKYALDAIKQLYSTPEITLVGLRPILDLYREDNYTYRFIEDQSKQNKNRFKAILKLGKHAGKHDIAFTFQNSLLSALLLFASRSNKRIGMKKELRSPLLTHALKPSHAHQAYEYLRLASFEQQEILKIKTTAFAIKKHTVKNKIGIAPGAAYGSSKRWGAKNFARLIELSKKYDFYLYGSSGDEDTGSSIASILKSKDIKHQNLIGKTSIKELLREIASCEYFISNDSGAMHLAAALGVPTIAIFGPTDETKTSIWDNTPNQIVKKPIPCSPCKHRVCPKPIHECMESITPQELIGQIEKF